MRKILLISIILILILVAVISGFYFLSRENTYPKEGLVQKKDIDISGWKTYSNEEFGYSFKYPSRFSIIQPLAQGYKGGNILVDSDESYLTIYVVTTPHPGLGGTEDLEINGYKATLSSSAGYKTGINIYKGEDLIVIYLRNADNKINQDDEDLFMKIISTIELSS